MKSWGIFVPERHSGCPFSEGRKPELHSGTFFSWHWYNTPLTECCVVMHSGTFFFKEKALNEML
jgi:hypothetical protein